MKKILFLKISAAAVCLFFVFPFFAKAESYDAYVDAGYSGEEDGSKGKPFNDINEAIESGAKKIFINKGKYEGKVTLEKSTKLYGKSRGDVTIESSVVMGDKTSIKNITISAGVIVEKNSEATIEKCNIKNFGLIGIDIAAGDGKLTVTDSKIYNGTGKGMYIQAGNEVKISKNEIYGNSQEGIDVRAKVSGVISGNLIYDNGESGIEIIAGSSGVSIVGNTIKKNTASGIAAQFYQENKKNGDILIEKNILSSNNKYGIDCATPSGGNPSSDYWKNSLNLSGNTIKDNKKSAINDFCDILEIVEKEDEAKDNKIENTIPTEEERKEEDLDRELEILKNADPIREEIVGIKDEIKKSEEKISQRSSFFRFIAGPNLEELNKLKEKKDLLNDKKMQMEAFLDQVKNEELRQSLISTIAEISEETGKCERLIDENEKIFSIFGWYLKIFYSHRNTK